LEHTLHAPEAAAREHGGLGWSRGCGLVDGWRRRVDRQQALRAARQGPEAEGGQRNDRGDRKALGQLGQTDHRNLPRDRLARAWCCNLARSSAKSSTIAGL